MHAGRLRERITIRRPSNTKTATGGLERSWATLAQNVSAEVLSLDGREAVIGHVLQGTSTYRITVRYRDDLAQSDQVLWGTRELNILSAEQLDGGRQWTAIVATSATPQGA